MKSAKVLQIIHVERHHWLVRKEIQVDVLDTCAGRQRCCLQHGSGSAQNRTVTLLKKEIQKIEINKENVNCKIVNSQHKDGRRKT